MFTGFTTSQGARVVVNGNHIVRILRETTGSQTRFTILMSDGERILTEGMHASAASRLLERLTRTEDFKPAAYSKYGD